MDSVTDTLRPSPALEAAVIAGLGARVRAPHPGSSAAVAALRNTRMRWNLCWVNEVTTGVEMNYAAYDTLDEMVAAIEFGIKVYGDEFDVKRCFYGAEIGLDINMVVRVDLRVGTAP